MAKRTAPLSETATEVLRVLTEATEPMTLADVKEVVPTANPAHLTALANRGLVNAEKVEKVVVVESKRKVNQYSAVELEDAE